MLHPANGSYWQAVREDFLADAAANETLNMEIAVVPVIRVGRIPNLSQGDVARLGQQ